MCHSLKKFENDWCRVKLNDKIQDRVSGPVQDKLESELIQDKIEYLSLYKIK